MDLTSRILDEITIITISGKVDSHYDKFRDNLLKIVTDRKKVIINFSGLVYITSFGLRAFLSVLKELTRSGGRLMVCCLDDFVRNTFLITGFLQLFEVYNTEEEAITKLKIVN
jgi:anti-sigma B factor antagonist